MNRCLRCSKECGTTAFCHTCQSSLLHRFKQKEGTNETVPLFTQTSPPHAREQQSGSPIRTLRNSRIISPQDVTQDDTCENALQARALVLRNQWRLQAIEEPPSVTSCGDEQVRIEEQKQIRDHSALLLARIRWMRVAFVILSLLAIVSLIVDGTLVLSVLKRQQAGISNGSGAFPVLTLTPAVVYPGQVVRVHLSNFASASRVQLTRDVAESMRMDTTSPLVQMGATGEADVHILVEDSWESGFHMIEAEDVDTHYTASVALNVIGVGPTQAPRLEVSQTELDMGRDLQGATTIQPLILHNTGGGIVTWEAKSSQSWLMLSPPQGVFSASQRISVAVNRARLQPGSYTGMLTFVSNTNASITVHVKMSVLPLPTNAGAVLVVTPPVLAFTASDGGTDPPDQQLTVSNPGTRPLYWSFGASTPTVSVNQDMSVLSDMNWLSTKPTSGMVAPGATERVSITVHSHVLLPGIYTGMLMFTAGQDALNNPQAVAVSLIVLPHCSVATSMQSVSFTVVAGQDKPDTQTLGLSMQSSCTGSITWQAFSSANWLVISPSRGKVEERRDAAMTISVKSGSLQPGTYMTSLVFLTEQHTQTVSVQLNVLSSALPTSATATVSITLPQQATATTGTAASTATPLVASPPVLALAPSDITFSVTQGQPDPPGQAVTLANTGGGMLYWQAHIDSSALSWLKMSTTSGTISSGQTGQMVLYTSASGLSAGTYKTQVLLAASDASGAQVQGGAQTIQVTFIVFQPCTLQVSPGSLQFTSSLSNPNPAGQDITVSESGNCSRPVSWTAVVDAGSRKWLVLSTTSSTDNSTVMVHVNTQGMLLGNYQGQITFSATDSNGTAIQHSSQVVSVTLTVGV